MFLLALRHTIIFFPWCIHTIQAKAETLSEIDPDLNIQLDGITIDGFDHIGIIWSGCVRSEGKEKK